MAALPLFERRHRQRAAMLIISDGADTASDASIRDVRSALLRSDAFVYAIAIDTKTSQAINTRVSPQTLREITDPSGGRTDVVHTSDELQASTARIADELSQPVPARLRVAQGSDGQVSQYPRPREGHRLQGPRPERLRRS